MSAALQKFELTGLDRNASPLRSGQDVWRQAIQELGNSRDGAPGPQCHEGDVMRRTTSTSSVNTSRSADRQVNLSLAETAAFPRTRVHDPSPEYEFTGTLLGRLDAFLEAWQSAEWPPSLHDFLPAGPREVRREALIQFVMADLEYRHRRGFTKRIEDYAAEFPEISADGIPCELVFEEYQVRRSVGEVVDPEEYYRRFPERAHELRRWFSMAAPTETMTIAAGVQRVLQVGVGETLDDFQLLSLLGEGAFGRVFLARQRSMHRLVALKVSADRGAEPQTLAQLDHPNIVRVYDQRRLPARGLRLMYMQYVAGGTLQDVVRRVRETLPEQRRGELLLEVVDAAVERGGQPAMSRAAERRRVAAATWPEVVCRIGRQLAQALDYAERRGVLHRDVKPANVLLAADCTPMLADFNVSSNCRLDDAACDAYFGGSLAYMSPEQLAACLPGRGAPRQSLDGRSDIYSLGILLWELLHGERPFDDAICDEGLEATIAQMLETRRAGPPPPPAGTSDPLAVVLDSILRRCLAPNPADRYPTARRLARELRVCLNPRAREILQERPRGWRLWAQKHPFAAGVVVGNGSHAVALAFVIVYLHFALIQRLAPEQQVAWYIQLSILAAFGFFLGGWLIWYFGGDIVRTLKRPINQTYDPDFVAHVRRQTLKLGPSAAPFGVLNWSVSGLWHVVFLSMLAGKLGWADCLNIMATHVVCGCVALVYPVLAGATVAVRAYYPALLARTPGEPNDQAALERLSERMSWVLPFAGLIPIFALSLLALSLDGLAPLPRCVAVGFVGVAGLVALPVAWRTLHNLQADLNALARATTDEESLPNTTMPR